MLQIFNLNLDLNSAIITNKQSLQNGRINCQTVPMKGFRTFPGVIISRSVLAQFNNDSVIPIYTIYDGLKKDYLVSGIFCDGGFQRNCPEFFAQYGLDSSDYELKRICEEFNSGDSVITENPIELEIENVFAAADTRLSYEQLVDKLNSIVDLRFSYEIYPPQDGAETFVSISTHNVMACRDSARYLMPCTVEFKNNVKTIGFCYVQPALGVATPYILLEDRLNSKLEKLQKNITSIRPLIVSPINNYGVRVSEGLRFRILSTNLLQLLNNKM